MLELKGIKKDGYYNVTIDYYVPFTIYYQTKDLEDMIGWRIGDFSKSLMEFSVGKESGILKDVTLTSVSNTYLTEDKLHYVDSYDWGIPILEIEGLKEIKEIVPNDISMEFDVFLGENFIKTVFGEDRKIIHEIAADRIRFGFNKKNELVSIIIIDLSKDEYEEIKNGLKL